MEPASKDSVRNGSLHNTASTASSWELPLEQRYKMTQQELRDWEKRRILDGYQDLPPMPPELSPPEYIVDGQSSYSKDDESLAFYDHCARGNLELVWIHAESSKVPHADLQYGLENASHNFQIPVVRYLLQEQSTQLHTRAFVIQNDKEPPEEERSIFSSGSPKLKDLLEAFLDNGWHPNQVFVPEEKGRRKRTFVKNRVAIHYQCCIEDLEILRLLLEHGADPTIARRVYITEWFLHYPWEAPIQRKSGDVLHTAVEMGSTEAVDLLVSHGARPEYGGSLHRLIGGFDSMETATRYAMAEHMLNIGDDINGLRYINHIKAYSIIAVGGSVLVTPLSHAVSLREWGWVEWLLERGADPEAHDRRAFHILDTQLYWRAHTDHPGGYDERQENDELIRLIEKTKKKKDQAVRTV